MTGGEEIKEIPGLSPVEAAALDSSDLDASTSESERSKDVKETKQLTRGLSADSLKKEAAEREHDRNERFRDHFEFLATIFLYLIGSLFFLVGFGWFYHLLTPVSWHFINATQIANLQNIVTGGLLTGLAAGHIKKRLG